MIALCRSALDATEIVDAIEGEGHRARAVHTPTAATTVFMLAVRELGFGGSARDTDLAHHIVDSRRLPEPSKQLNGILLVRSRKIDQLRSIGLTTKDSVGSVEGIPAEPEARGYQQIPR